VGVKVALAISSKIPALKYGGSERVFLWLASALQRHGIEVTLVCGQWDPSMAHQNLNFQHARSWNQSRDEWIALSRTVDLVHFMGTPPENFPRELPHLCTIHGNGKVGDPFPNNCVFVSQDHAARHSWTEFVHNGLDLSEYPLFDGTRQASLLFLAKARWRVKNLRGAIEIARAARRPLSVIGGRRPIAPWGLFAFHAKFHGEIGGPTKLKVIQESSALLFPVIWEEPFGIAVIEALACGTPAIVANRGAMPEIISPECGRICSSFTDYLQAIDELKKFNDPQACRNRVAQLFSDEVMAEKYVAYYKKISTHNRLRDGQPKTLSNPTRETPGFAELR